MPRTLRRADLADAAPVARVAGAAVEAGRGTTPGRFVGLTLPRGSFHFLTGGPGSGKTTLLRTLALDRRPGAGEVELFGTDPWASTAAQRARLRRRIGVVERPAQLIDRLTVFQNAALPLALAGESPADRRADVTEMLTWLGLGAVADRPAGTLDAAGRQALAVARALAPRPELILMDEPLLDLAPDLAERILTLLAALGGGQAAVVLAGRDPARARKAGARVLTLTRPDGEAR